MVIHPVKKALVAALLFILPMRFAVAADGDVETNFNTILPYGTEVYRVTVQPDGKILIGGFITSVNGVTRNRMARLNTNGSLDLGFNPNPGGLVGAITMQMDEKILVAGYNKSVGGIVRSFARLWPDGSADTNFLTTSQGDIWSDSLQPDGRMVVSGLFTFVNGISRNRIEIGRAHV